MQESKSGTFYLVTPFYGTHIRRNMPIDPRFTELGGKCVYYLVDEQRDPSWQIPGPVVMERELSHELWVAGRENLAEWSFLLNEYYTPFVSYPFYVLSTRFYEKNHRLKVSLNKLAELLFAGLDRYGWAYLPSYDRPPGFEDLLGYAQGVHLGIESKGCALVKDLLGADPVFEARWFSDFFCNYIGFKSREEFVRYVEFYLPLIQYFMDDKWRLKKDFTGYVSPLHVYRREKPLTFLIEMASHLFFYQNRVPFFGVHPEGFFEINEYGAGIRTITDLQASPACMESWGQQLIEMRQFTLGEQYLEHTILLDPKRQNAYLLLIKTWIQCGEISRAREVLRRGLQHCPGLRAISPKFEEQLKVK